MLADIITVTGANNGRKFDILTQHVISYEPVVPEDPKQVSTATVVTCAFGRQFVVRETVEEIRHSMKRTTSGLAPVAEISREGKA